MKLKHLEKSNSDTVLPKHVGIPIEPQPGTNGFGLYRIVTYHDNLETLHHGSTNS